MLEGRSCWDIEREDGIGHAITNRWLRNYSEFGDAGLDKKKKRSRSHNYGCEDSLDIICLNSIAELLICTQINNSYFIIN